MKQIIAILSLILTWGSFEFYHQMRDAEAFSWASIGYALLSVVCVLSGTLVGRVALEMKD